MGALSGGRLFVVCWLRSVAMRVLVWRGGGLWAGVCSERLVVLDRLAVLERLLVLERLGRLEHLVVLGSLVVVLERLGRLVLERLGLLRRLEEALFWREGELSE